ncbi:unnamed protein product [Paramecium sonneborni]|uniref:Uncharacterized protein n=1 Tax=Paramecium sonneborni TaxID=65129 RepID=A0A8S1M5B0_9CILI|nr:unnamed protein product [Paramecium sonneborni]
MDALMDQLNCLMQLKISLQENINYSTQKFKKLQLLNRLSILYQQLSLKIQNKQKAFQFKKIKQLLQK